MAGASLLAQMNRILQSLITEQFVSDLDLYCLTVGEYFLSTIFNRDFP